MTVDLFITCQRGIFCTWKFGGNGTGSHTDALLLACISSQIRGTHSLPLPRCGGPGPKSSAPGASTFPVELLALQLSRPAVPLVAVAGAVLTAVTILHVDVGGAGGRGAVAELGQIALRVGGGTAQSVGSFELGGNTNRSLLLMASGHCKPPAASPSNFPPEF